MLSLSPDYSNLLSLIANAEREIVVETFDGKRKLAIAAGVLSGITLLVVGILALLHMGSLGNLSPAGAWSLTLIGIASICISLGYLIYNIRSEGRIKREMHEFLDSPAFDSHFSQDATKILSNRSQLRDRYLLLGDNHGLLKLGTKAGFFWLNGESRGGIFLFVDETARDAWLQTRFDNTTKPFSWQELRALPSLASKVD